MYKTQKWSNKRIFLTTLIILLIATFIVSAGAGIYYLINKPKPILIDIGETIALNPTEDYESQSSTKLYAGLAWESGTIQLTVNSVQIFNSFSEAGIDVAECIDTLEKDFPFLLLDMTFKNIDASNYDTDQTYDGSTNFCLGGFGTLVTSEAFEGRNALKDTYLTREAVYFSAHKLFTEASKDYYFCDLEPGDSLTCQIGFSLEEADREYVFDIGASSEHKYGVRLYTEQN